MRSTFIVMASALAGMALAPAWAVPGGEIATLPLGDYICELPGDAAGAWRIRVPEEDFTVLSASSYRANGKRGTYLLTSESLFMTSGPFDGKRYHRQSRGFLRMIGEDGKPGKLRCILSGRNNS